ncbi:MAG: MFS transporter [Chloroflexi bacterium]|nr:MFS transporter [Chloroflexota bacterium]
MSQSVTHVLPAVTETTVEDRSSSAPRFETGHVLTISTAHAIHDTFQGFLSPLLPAFIQNFSLSKAQAGSLSVFLELPSLLQPVIGHLGDRFNSRYLVILGPAVTAVMMSLLGIAPSYAALAVLLAVAGFSRAAFHAVAPIAVGNLSGRRLGRGMGFWMVGGQIGPALGPIVVVSAVSLLGLRGLPCVMILGVLGSFVLYVRLRGVQLQPPRTQGGLPLGQALRGMRRIMLPVATIVLLRAVLTTALSVYLPTFLTEQGAQLWLAGISLSLLEGAGTIGALLAGSVSDRLGRQPTLIASFLTAPLFMFSFLRTSGWSQVISLFLLGFTSLATMPVFMALLLESFPESRALANGIYLALTFVGRSFIAVIVGAFADRFGLEKAFIIGALILLLAVPLVRLLPGKSDRRESESTP